MGKLVLSMNGAVQGEYKLDKERVFLGRKPENEIQVDNLAVSGKHALIVTILDDSFLEDLGSTNGTYVNGKLIRKKHALSNGDVIGIGKHELSYINEHATADDEEFEKTMIVKPGSAIAAAAIAEAAEKAVKEVAPGAQAAAASAIPLGKIHVLNGPVAGKELPLTKALITLGRPGAQVAVISRRPQGYFLTHIEGKNDYGPLYPIVNGEPIGPKAFSLQDRDIVEIAGIKMEFTLNE
ncbi:MAG: FHA domain-containing protein [Gammaproteobacteria bacterium]